MSDNQKKTSLMFPLGMLGAAFVLLVVFSLLTNRLSLNSSGREVQPQVNQEELPAIQNTDDLNKVDSELVNVDLNQFDKELNQLDVDASTF